jgi:hypothetical protein
MAPRPARLFAGHPGKGSYAALSNVFVGLKSTMPIFTSSKPSTRDEQHARIRRAERTERMWFASLLAAIIILVGATLWLHYH